MVDCLLDGLLDTLKILPYLFVAFLILEYVEHKIAGKSKKKLINNKKFGPIIGALLGAFPQCGFSSIAANLFSNKIITTGTLIAVFLSTSDEMLPIMIGESVNLTTIFGIISFKVAIGIIIGIAVDLVYKKKVPAKETDKIHVCEEEHCDCEHRGIIVSSLIHTAKISGFILVINLLLNILFFYVGEENLSNLLLQKNILAYFLASLVGLIPNCASSIVTTKLFLAGLITPGVMIAGLLTGSGLGILLLFKTNKNLKENLGITLCIYVVGVIFGALVDLII